MRLPARLSSRASIGIGAGFLLILFSHRLAAAAGGADEIDQLTLAPLTPGSVALFSRHSSDPRVAARLRTALSSPSSSVRAVTARVIAVGGLASLISDLKDALARESDAEAAREEIRALCTVAGPAADPEALAAAKRFSPRLDANYVLMIARLRGIQALQVYFSTLRDLQLSPHDRQSFFRLAANRDGPEVLDAAGSLSLGRGAAKEWTAILDVAATRNITLDEGPLLAALRGHDTILRGEAAWYLAKAHRQKPTPRSSEILEAVSSDTPPPPDPELRFGLEMLRRAMGRPATEDEGWIACLEANPECHLDSDLGESPLVDLLTEREAEAVMRRNRRGRLGIGSSSPPKSPPAQKNIPSAEPAIGLRLVTGLPKGMVSDLMSVSGCNSWTKPGSSYTLAEIDFWPHGLPRQVHVVPLSSTRCESAAEAIFLMTAESDDGRPPSKRNFYMALLDGDVLGCDDLTLPPNTTVSTNIQMVRGRITAPKLVRKTEPKYPEEARRQGHKGISVFEAIISQSGCVGDVQLIRSSYPDLDISGMMAVSRWRYTPATLDGKPVRVYLTVTVTYNLTH